MDLYGDLPPTSDGSSGDANPVVIGAGWSNSGTATKPTPPAADISSTKKVALEKKVVKTTSFVPTSSVRKIVPAAAFKPRQTAVSAPTASTIPVPKTKPAFSLLAPVVTSETVTRKKIGESDTSSLVPQVSLDQFSDFSSRVPSPSTHSNPAVTTYDCNDPYDPSKPNDYIQWCEERVERKRLRRLEKDNLRVLDEVEKARAEKERERAEALEKGDMVKLQASMGRGRGRGSLTNLPAWMTAANSETKGENTESKQPSPPRIPGQFDDNQPVESNPNKDGAEARGSANIGSHIMTQMGYEGKGTGLGRSGQGIVTPIDVQQTPSGQGRLVISSQDHDRFMQQDSQSAPNRISSEREDASGQRNKRKRGIFTTPSCVVLVKNMVASGEVDDGLAQETQEECSKYGAVKTCVIRELSGEDIPEEEKVRLFVCFERQDGAVRACRDLNKRFFGGRQISAVFFDETRFEKRDLDPSLGEW